MGASLLAGMSAVLGMIVLTLVRHVPKGKSTSTARARAKRVGPASDDDEEVDSSDLPAA